MKRFLIYLLTFVLVGGLCAFGLWDSFGESAETTRTLETDVAARREAILTSATQIVKSETYVRGETYTGTAYYISNNGSDDNDGRSPETAFATFAPLNREALRSGDAVFLERGSVWRAQRLPYRVLETEDITVSAYGEGEKPGIYASPENGTGAEKWELYHTDDSGRKVWKFYRALSEVGGIVLDDKTVTARDVAYWDGSTYYNVDKYELYTEELYDVKEHLEDMTCFPMLLYPQSREDTGRIYVTHYSDDGPHFVEGTLYLRCDAGNPGELYEQIEFISPYYFTDGLANGLVLDNLAMKYSTFGVCNGQWTDGTPVRDSMIQNCEVGYFGGSVQWYNEGSFAEENVTNDQRERCAQFESGGIGLDGSGNVVRNNYVHHIYWGGISMEMREENGPLQDVAVSGNLLEYCGQSLSVNSPPHMDASEVMFRNCVVEGNIAIDTGYEHWHTYPYLHYHDAAFALYGACSHDGTLAVRNNVFAFAQDRLIHFSECDEENQRIFMGNTYIQGQDLVVILRTNGDEASVIVNPVDATFENLMGDTESVLLRPVRTARDSKAK